MPIDADPPLFPPQEPLTRFFAADRRKGVPIAQVAGLLGVTTAAFRATLDREGGRRRSGTLAWAEAAGYLFDAWPRARLLETLGPAQARRVPEQFHPTGVRWSVPVFIVRAMEHQAAADPRGVDDYVADLLFNEIQPQTVIAFRDDPAFLAAYQFP